MWTKAACCLAEKGYHWLTRVNYLSINNNFLKAPESFTHIIFVFQDQAQRTLSSPSSSSPSVAPTPSAHRALGTVHRACQVSALGCTLGSSAVRTSNAWPNLTRLQPSLHSPQRKVCARIHLNLVKCVWPLHPHAQAYL